MCDDTVNWEKHFFQMCKHPGGSPASPKVLKYGLASVNNISKTTNWNDLIFRIVLLYRKLYEVYEIKMK